MGQSLWRGRWQGWQGRASHDCLAFLIDHEVVHRQIALVRRRRPADRLCTSTPRSPAAATSSSRPVLAHELDRHRREYGLSRLEKTLLPRIDGVSHIIVNIHIPQYLRQTKPCRIRREDVSEKQCTSGTCRVLRWIIAPGEFWGRCQRCGRYRPIVW